MLILNRNELQVITCKIYVREAPGILSCASFISEKKGGGNRKGGRGRGRKGGEKERERKGGVERGREEEKGKGREGEKKEEKRENGERKVRRG